MKFMIGIFLCGVSFFLSASAPNEAARFFEAGVQKLEPPVAAPDFTLPELAGGKISLEELKGKVVLLNFFTSGCPICQKEASSFDKLDEIMKNKDLALLQVAVKEDREEVKKFKGKFKISIPILLDEDGSVARAYGVWGHHQIFFIDRKGRIVGKSFGGRDLTSSSMRKLLQDLLAEKK